MTYKPTFYFKYPCIQLNFSKSWYDYYSISLFYPFIEVGKINEEIDGTNIIYSINAPTTISLIKSNIHIGMKFQILGFGVGLLRQTSY